jgi:putative inorganic carbon (hco3(-)) transporter
MELTPSFSRIRDLHRTWILPVTWTEVGLGAILVYGALLGALKRSAPANESIVSVGFDALCFGLLAYVVIRRLLRSRKLPYSPITLPLLAFCAFTFLTIINPEVTRWERGLLGWRLVASSLLLHFLGFYAFDSFQRLHRFLILFWYVAGAVALYGVIQLLRGFTAAEWVWIQALPAAMRIQGTGRYRILSTMGSAVDLGFFLSLSVVSLLTMLTYRGEKNLLRQGLLLLMFVSLTYTFTRAAWVATFLGVLFVLAYRMWHLKKLRLLLPTILLGAAFIAISLPFFANAISNVVENPALRERVGSLSNPIQDKSMQDRYATWASNWALVKRYPLGMGAGMTGAAGLRYPEPPGPTPVTIDNSYLKVLLETGWLGLALFLWLLGATLYRGVKLTSHLRDRYQATGLALSGCFIVFLVIMFFGEYIELNPARSIIWILSGLLFSLPRLQRMEQANS